MGKLLADGTYTIDNYHFVAANNADGLTEFNIQDYIDSLMPGIQAQYMVNNSAIGFNLGKNVADICLDETPADDVQVTLNY